MVLLNVKMEILELLIWEGDIFLSIELEMELGVVLKSMVMMIWKVVGILVSSVYEFLECLVCMNLMYLFIYQVCDLNFGGGKLGEVQ